MKAWIWKRWKENIYLDQTLQEWFMLSWSAKWLGEKEAFGYVLHPDEVEQEDDSRLLIALHKVFDSPKDKLIFEVYV